MLQLNPITSKRMIFICARLLPTQVSGSERNCVFALRQKKVAVQTFKSANGRRVHDMPSVSLPYGAEQVRLGELDDDGSRAQLVAGVPRVPVVVARVSV